MTTDVTTATRKVFDALDQICRDLNSLASDFGSALEQRGHVFENEMEYSYSPQTGLIVKPRYTWYWETRTQDARGVTTVQLAAMIVVFRFDKGMVPVAGQRPQLWFALGSGEGAAIKASSVQSSSIHGFLTDSWEGTLDPALHLGTPATIYSYADPGETWRVSLLGVELGAIDSQEALADKIVTPLLAAL
jgi:hypothetical protein